MNTNEASAALHAATVFAAGKDDNPEFTKKSLQKLKSAGEIDRNELQKLNNQLEVYLDRARRLEADNQKLIKDVEAAKANKIPKFDDRKDLDSELNKARVMLENESINCVKKEAEIERDENAKNEYLARIKFYQNENDLQKQKIAKLQGILDNIDNEKDYIYRSTRQVEDDIIREQEKMANIEDDLEKLRKQLSDDRYSNKKIEFEIQTLQDELVFSRALHDEEVAALKQSFKGAPSKVDLTTFYRNELNNAVKNIRSDFHKLKDQQLADLKAQKENELQFYKDQAEKQKQDAMMLKSKRAQSGERDPHEAQLLKDDLNQLTAENIQKANRLAELEDQLADLRRLHGAELDMRDNEINDLKNENNNYMNELEYFDRVTRDKLESEIKTYHHLLELTAPSKNESRPTSVSISNSSQSHNKLPSPVKSVSPQRPASKPIVQQPNFEIKAETRPSSIIISSANGSSQKPPSPTPQVRPSSVIISGATNKPPSPVPSENGSTRPSTVIISSSQQSQKLPSPVKIMPSTPLQSRPPVENHEMTFLRKIFDQFDRDNSGRINSYELEDIILAIDPNVSGNAMNQILKDIDSDSSRDIDFDEFCIIMQPALTGKFNRNELLNAFKRFDKDNSGQISVQELAQILKNFGNYSESQIASLVATVDRDGNGQLSFDEFAELISRPLSTESTINPEARQRKSVTYTATAEPPVIIQNPKSSSTRDILRNIFNKFDADRSGQININELNNIFKALDMQITKKQYDYMLRDFDTDKSETINFDEFCKIMEPAMSGEFSDEELYNAFKQFDKDGSGSISVNELSRVFETLGMPCDERQLEAIIKSVDKNNDGQLSFQEFLVLMKQPI